MRNPAAGRPVSGGRGPDPSRRIPPPLCAAPAGPHRSEVKTPPPPLSPPRGTAALPLPARARYRQLEAALAAHPPELRTLVELTAWLHWRTTDEPGPHVLHGGHVRMMDGGRLYRWVRGYLAGGRRWDWWWGGPGRRGGSRRWLQSHRTLDLPVEVTLPSRLLTGWGCLLVGTHDHGTWFQAEATSVRRGLAALLYHNVVDYTTYRLTGRQIGPLGRSTRTEADPLVVPAAVAEEGLTAWGVP
jgi:hypothetical protein